MRNEYGGPTDKIFDYWRRVDQTPPVQADWTTWLLLGGRGAGKTRTGAEWIRRVAHMLDAPRIALVAQTYADAREVMIEGQSGLRSTRWCCGVLLFC